VNINRLPEDIVIRPILTERSMSVIEAGKYTFEVAIDATKPEIIHAVQQLFSVKVVKVATIIYKGKKKRVRYKEGMTKKWKKAIVYIDLDPEDKKWKTSIEEFMIA